MILLIIVKKNSLLARKGNIMIPACILFIFASGYGVATKECREGTVYYTPDEIVHVTSDFLSTPPDMILIDPDSRWVSRWYQPTYFQVKRRYIERTYYYDQPVVGHRSPSIVVRPRVQVDFGSPRVVVSNRKRVRRGFPRLKPRSKRYRKRQPRYNLKRRKKSGGTFKRKARKKVRGNRIKKRNKRQRRTRQRRLARR